MYTLPREVLPEAVADALQALYGGRLVRADEDWGSRRVVRLVLQFQVEFRVGERPRTISMHHRSLSPAASRLEHHARFEQVIAELARSWFAAPSAGKPASAPMPTKKTT